MFPPDLGVMMINVTKHSQLDPYLLEEIQQHYPSRSSTSFHSMTIRLEFAQNPHPKFKF